MISIAIDGPAGAGKSTIAKKAAEELGFIYVDTGALYRTVGLYMLNKGVQTTNAAEVCPLLKKIQIELVFQNKEQRVMLCGRDVTKDIRTEEVSMAASNVSAIPEVRKFLFSLQKDIAKHNNVIMDGRDIGTVILPNAQVKIFLTATAEERAKRRYKQLNNKNLDYSEILKDIKKRDYNDSHRAAAPLIPADDAVILDTTNYNLEQSLKKLITIINNKLH